MNQNFYSFRFFAFFLLLILQFLQIEAFEDELETDNLNENLTAASLPSHLSSVETVPDREKGKPKPWQPNYCNDTKLQQDAGLVKTALGQFLGYQCDSTFFQCRWGIDGWRTYKKLCRKGLVYDAAGTQTCNYDFNVQGCGFEQCADCLKGQFACCLSEECVEMGQRCDGKYDCSLEEDEQNCPTCTKIEFPCFISDQCISMDQRCNGIKECKDGTDELNCEECPNNSYFCRTSKECVEASKRCNGKRDCATGDDESFCNFEAEKDYTCENQVEKNFNAEPLRRDSGLFGRQRRTLLRSIRRQKKRNLDKWNIFMKSENRPEKKKNLVEKIDFRF